MSTNTVPDQQIVSALRHKVGDVVVTAVADGYIPLGADAVPNASQTDLDPYYEHAMIAPKDFKTNVNCYVLDFPDRRVLIDAGGYQFSTKTMGRVPDVLTQIGVEPDSVDVLVMTHLHPDHAGGTYLDDGSARFPNARLILNEREIAFWRDDSQANIDREGDKGDFKIAHALLDAYADRTTAFSEESEVVPGMTSVPLYGHTPGHTGYHLKSKGEELLVWADIVHMPAMQLGNPDFYIKLDVTPEEAVATRKRTLEWVADEKLTICGMHLPFPGFGHLRRSAADGIEYEFVPLPYEYAV